MSNKIVVVVVVEAAAVKSSEFAITIIHNQLAFRMGRKKRAKIAFVFKCVC